MVGPTLIAAIAIGYLLVLFALAYFVERQPGHGTRVINSSFVYTLSLATYCTSWTFYGSVGRASQGGIAFLPIYMGPTLAFCLGWVLLRKLLRVSRANRITSIASLIASRYGKSAGLGATITVVAIIGLVPYIALQLKAVSASFTIITSGIATQPGALPSQIFGDAGLWAAILLTLFAMLFGSRSIQPGEHHQGMVAAVAFESIVKLVSLIAVGLFVGFALFDNFGDLFRHAASKPDLAPLFQTGQTSDRLNWIVLTVLSFAAVICLPRQFQVMVVENVDERHLNRALWLFPLYLLAINLFVLPIALAGRLVLPAGADPDGIVLTLPLNAGHPVLAAVVFIGGLSASAGMIIVETTALSTMFCNDLMMPVLLRIGQRQLFARRDLIPLLLWIRRIAMMLVMALGYIYMRYVSEESPLVSIGLISFVAVAQFFPAMVLGLFWRRATRIGALAGVVAGFVIWAYTLLLPAFATSGLIPTSFVDHGLFGIELLKPYSLLGMTGIDPVVHSFFWSMLMNCGLLVGLSLFVRQSPIERAQAALFVNAFQGADAAQLWRRTATMPDLQTLVGRFLGHRQTEAAFLERAQRRGLDPESFEADAETVLYAERLLAGAIGSASARALVGSVVKEEPLGIDEVMRILDETSRVIESNRQLEEKSRALEAAGEELRRANERLQELDRLKDEFVSTVNHELRTPLTSIRSFSEILLENPHLNADRRAEFCTIIVRETERLTRLINQMLDLARIQSGEFPTHLAPIDLAEIVRDATAATSNVLSEKGIKLRIDAAPNTPMVQGDRDLLMQVMLNLLSNAVKFCPRDRGRVDISIAAANAEWVDLVVADNGPGIPPELHEVVFERFRQVGDAVTGKPQGTGLGLSICRMIVTRLGGTIRIDESASGGAAFRVRLRGLGMAQSADENDRPQELAAAGKS
ncbi:MAG TPA: ATP-binding protein [Magnetospirillaceae bacterium]|jgi:Na+/proline symporter/nitrogen-specific signal transduction histidine kinase